MPARTAPSIAKNLYNFFLFILFEDVSFKIVKLFLENEFKLMNSNNTISFHIGLFLYQIYVFF